MAHDSAEAEASFKRAIGPIPPGLSLPHFFFLLPRVCRGHAHPFTPAGYGVCRTRFILSSAFQLCPFEQFLPIPHPTPDTQPQAPLRRRLYVLSQLGLFRLPPGPPLLSRTYFISFLVSERSSFPPTRVCLLQHGASLFSITLSPKIWAPFTRIHVTFAPQWCFRTSQSHTFVDSSKLLS